MCTEHTYRNDVQVSRQELRDDGEPSREKRGNEEPEKTDDDGIGDDIRDEPEQELHDEANDDIDEYHGPLADLARDVGEEEATECEAAPKA